MCKNKIKNETYNLRQVKFQREFAVFLQGQIPISIHGYWVGCFETTFAFLLESSGNKIVAKCLKLKRGKTGTFSIVVLSYDNNIICSQPNF